MNRSFKILLSLLMTLGAFYTTAQMRQGEDTTSYQTIIPTDKQGMLSNMDMIANMQYNYRSDFQDGEYQGSKFRFEQFRLEIKGYVHEKVFFRFRHRYTSDFTPQVEDKIIKGVDFAYVRFDLSDKTQLTVGKTFADWGGWEFDINPVEIYVYSDIIEEADNFLSGVGVYHQLTDNHGFSAQILNSRTGDFQTIYDSVPNITAAKAPLAGVVNWRGTFLDGRVTTLWSYSLFTEAQGKYKNYIALGTQYKSKNDKFQVAYDFKWSNEDLDRTGIISREIPDSLYNYAVENTLYYSHWVQLQYKLTPKWQLALYAFVDIAEWKGDLDPLKNTNDFRTVYSYIPTIEFFPFENLNFKFFLNYVGRHYRYSDYAKERLYNEDYDTQRINIGFVSPLNIF